MLVGCSLETRLKLQQRVVKHLHFLLKKGILGVNWLSKFTTFLNFRVFAPLPSFSFLTPLAKAMTRCQQSSLIGILVLHIHSTFQCDFDLASTTSLPAAFVLFLQNNFRTTTISELKVQSGWVNQSIFIAINIETNYSINMGLARHSSSLKRSSTSLDLLSTPSDCDDVDMSPKSKKRMADAVFGWDHYGSYNNSTVKSDSDEKKYHSWRNKKRSRVQPQQPKLFHISLHSPIFPINEEEPIGLDFSSDISCSSIESISIDSGTQNALQTQPPLVNEVTEMLAITMV